LSDFITNDENGVPGLTDVIVQPSRGRGTSRQIGTVGAIDPCDGLCHAKDGCIPEGKHTLIRQMVRRNHRKGIKNCPFVPILADSEAISAILESRLVGDGKGIAAPLPRKRSTENRILFDPAIVGPHVKGRASSA